MCKNLPSGKLCIFGWHDSSIKIFQEWWRKWKKMACRIWKLEIKTWRKFTGLHMGTLTSNLDQRSHTHKWHNDNEFLGKIKKCNKRQLSHPSRPFHRWLKLQNDWRYGLIFVFYLQAVSCEGRRSSNHSGCPGKNETFDYLSIYGCKSI
jgi:hypothetical protein